MVSSFNNVYDEIENSYPMYEHRGVVSPGQNLPFNFVANIPQNIFSYTAIGRVVARYFILHLYT